MARRITILGMGPSASERCHDIAKYCEGTEIWSLNNAYNRFPSLIGGGFDRFYELHSWAYLKTWSQGQLPDGSEVDHWGNLAKLGCKVFTGQHIPLVQDQEQIDWDALWRHWHDKVFQYVAAPDCNCYFLGSPSIMLAHALYEHDQGDTIEYIQSLGIDTTDGRHQQQRHSWSFWIGQALARGITVGGSACGYMLEFENDEGLRGLRELVNERLQKTTPKTGPVDDYVVCTFCTPSETYDPDPYVAGFSRIKAFCKREGLTFHGNIEDTPADILAVENKEMRDKMRKIWIINRKPEIVQQALEKHNKPVFFLDCDDEFLSKPTFPVCDVGFLRNPEQNIPSTSFTHLCIASTAIIAPTEWGKTFVQRWRDYTKLVNDHRAIQMAWTQQFQRSGLWGTFVDCTEHMTGLYKINAAPDGHRTETVVYGLKP